MMRSDCAAWLLLLVLPLLVIGCGEPSPDGYHEVTDPVVSLPANTAAPQDRPPGSSSEPGHAVTPPDKLPADGMPADSDTAEDGVSPEPAGAESGTEPDSAGPDNARAAGTAVADRTADPENTPEDSGSPSSEDRAGKKPRREIRLLIPEKTFKVEGPEDAVRVSFDDVDLLKVLNMDPVVPQAPELLPDWLKQLDGKRIRIRGFMYPPFSETNIRAFTLARDTELCCFGRNPLPYDLIDVFLREGAETDYIDLRPFDVVGVFHIGEEIEPGYLYSIDDAVVIQ